MSEKTIAQTSTNSQTVQTLEQFVYKFGTSLMNLKTDSCPVEVFKPKCNWYVSLHENKDSYERQIKECERKLNLLSEEKIEEYVNKNFDAIYDELVDKANDKIKLYKSLKRNNKLTEGEQNEIEDFIKDLEKQIDLLPEYVERKLIHEYHKENHLYPEMKDELPQTIFMLERCKHENELAIADWKEKCLAKEKEEERKRLQEYLSLPHNNQDVIQHLNEFVHSCVNSNFSELLDEYYTMYERLFTDLDKSKYSKTIRNVFNEKNSKKVMKMFNEHNLIIENRLNHLINYVQFNKTDKFEAIEFELKKSFGKFIDDHFMSIYQFLNKSINNLKSNTKPFENSTALKTFAQMTVSQINQILIQELPNALNSKFEDYYLTLKEMVYGEEEERAKSPELQRSELVKESKENKESKDVHENKSISKVLSLELTIDSFLSTLPNEWIEINELVERYNKYFGANVNSRGFSRIKGIKDAFEKKTDRGNNKKTTLYRVIA